MRIGIEGRYVAPGGSGIPRYARNLMRAYLTLGTEDELIAFHTDRWSKLNLDDLPEALPPMHPLQPTMKTKTIGLVKRHIIHPMFRSATFFRGYSYVSRKAFDWLASSVKVDLFHALNFMPPDHVRAPTIPVVYDCSHIRHPETHPVARVRDMARLPQFLDRAPVVQTISEFSKREIMQVFGIPADRIGVVVPGISDIFMSAPTTRLETISKLGLKDGSFFLCVGTLEPRKNLKTVLEAHRSLPNQLRQDFPLVLVGGGGWGKASEWSMSHAERSLGLVRSTGYISDEQVRDLYSACRALLFPSVYEGYGLPVREALAAGAPTVISEAEVLNEAAEGYATILPTLDPSGWSAYMLAAIDTAPVRTVLAPPTWEDAAWRLADLYRTASNQI